MFKDVKHILISREQIEERIAEMSEQITRDYRGKELVLVCILRGASVFFADLIRKINIPMSVDFIAISSYGSGVRSSGEVRMLKDLNTSVEGKDVLIIEDIIDSGYTIKYLRQIIDARNPASVRVATLLDKPSKRETDEEGDYIGFEIPDEFVVGYGLDYAEKYRNLPDVCVLKPEVYANK